MRTAACCTHLFCGVHVKKNCSLDCAQVNQISLFILGLCFNVLFNLSYFLHFSENQLTAQAYLLT